MLGILVHGANHFIVNGPRPSWAHALLLSRKWEMPVPGTQPPWPPELDQWSICTKAFREDLEWALVLPSEEPHSPAVAQLLEELEGRGVRPVNGPCREL
ncbi:MAG TPA: hypothetical protein VM120_08495 [Bryobacteraceae bacterium]|nr:hypothetical protein [Bryobacteraceae bacterium]